MIEGKSLAIVLVVVGLLGLAAWAVLHPRVTHDLSPRYWASTDDFEPTIYNFKADGELVVVNTGAAHDCTFRWKRVGSRISRSAKCPEGQGGNSTGHWTMENGKLVSDESDLRPCPSQSMDCFGP